MWRIRVVGGLWWCREEEGWEEGSKKKKKKKGRNACVKAWVHAHSERTTS